MKIKTSELTGEALDWAVAVANGKKPSLFIFRQTGRLASGHRYSTDWVQGGPIIEREGIAIDFDGVRWTASANDRPICYSARTPLVAAMRCYVASELGDEVDVPEELL